MIHNLWEEELILMTEKFQGSWKDFFDIRLPDNIINVRVDYTESFLKFVEGVLDVPISYFYIFAKKHENKFLMQITVYLTNFKIIYKLKEYREDGRRWGLYEKAKESLFYNEPSLDLKLKIIKNDEEPFEIDKNSVVMYINGNIENVVNYTSKVLGLHFEDFVQQAFKNIVISTKDTYPITEKDFLKKYSYILKEVRRRLTTPLKSL